MTLESLLKNLWSQYTSIAPQAARIRALLEKRGETWHNDHIAFRTYDKAPINLEVLEPHLLGLGYQRFEPYNFADKKLRAFGYLHPDSSHPRIFLSELETHKLSPQANAAIDALVCQIDPKSIESPECLFAGPLWKRPSSEVYSKLTQESEYAGWVAVNGLCANHFTVSVNQLNSFPTLDALMTFLEAQGFEMNTAGGRIKGSESVLLEQGSTLADRQTVELADGPFEVTTCYVEFAKRYQGFNGFVPASANKIFESTNVSAS